MKSIFNQTDNQEIIARIQALTPQSQALWGKMSVDQMLKHCNDAAIVAFNEKDIKVNFIFKIMGSLMRKSILNAPEFSKNSPTAKEFMYAENFDFNTVQKELIANFSRFQEGEKAITCTKHPFWGNMTSEYWNKLMWKHLDHHLRQFGV
jgi:hypothetical protein